MSDNKAVYGQVTHGVLDSTNPLCDTTGVFWAYNKSLNLYHCPADNMQTQGIPRVRSFSMNGWVGSTNCHNVAYFNTPGAVNFLYYLKDSAVRSPAAIWYLIDEDPYSINDGFFWVDMTSTRPFADFPAPHNRGYCLSFCDGHSELYKLMDGRSNWPVPGNINTPANPDFAKLQSVTTVHY
jgi:hypothetical protein